MFTRSGKRGPKIIYLIANFDAKTKIHTKIYNDRWGIEECIRTSKQSLGLGQSSSRQATIYRNHIWAVFHSYAIAQLVKKKFRFKNVEEAIRKIQAQKYKQQINKNNDWLSLLSGYA